MVYLLSFARFLCLLKSDEGRAGHNLSPWGGERCISVVKTVRLYLSANLARNTFVSLLKCSVLSNLSYLKERTLKS